MFNAQYDAMNQTQKEAYLLQQRAMLNQNIESATTSAQRDELQIMLHLNTRETAEQAATEATTTANQITIITRPTAADETPEARRAANAQRTTAETAAYDAQQRADGQRDGQQDAERGQFEHSIYNRKNGVYCYAYTQAQGEENYSRYLTAHEELNELEATTDQEAEFYRNERANNAAHALHHATENAKRESLQ